VFTKPLFRNVLHNPVVVLLREYVPGVTQQRQLFTESHLSNGSIRHSIIEIINQEECALIRNLYYKLFLLFFLSELGCALHSDRQGTAFLPREFNWELIMYPISNMNTNLQILYIKTENILHGAE
jgi:hypothetical protein